MLGGLDVILGRVHRGFDHDKVVLSNSAGSSRWAWNIFALSRHIHPGLREGCGNREQNLGPFPMFSHSRPAHSPVKPHCDLISNHIWGPTGRRERGRIMHVQCCSWAMPNFGGETAFPILWKRQLSAAGVTLLGAWGAYITTYPDDLQGEELLLLEPKRPQIPRYVNETPTLAFRPKRQSRADSLGRCRTTHKPKVGIEAILATIADKCHLPSYSE